MPRSNPVLTVAQMRAAEKAEAPGAKALYALMERAGAAAADIIWRIAAGREILILCGPGNNGGDGYVAARVLRERNAPVRIASAGLPNSRLARIARMRWRGPVEDLLDSSSVRPAPVLVDCLFGIGQHRDLDPELMYEVAMLAERAKMRIAVDMPTGIASDGSIVLCSDPFPADVTVALGSLKPSHIQPAARRNCGRVVLADIGLDLGKWPVRTIGVPTPPVPTADTHKYNRGMVGIVAGEMPGAAVLAATAAARAGAGYVVLYGDAPGGPASVVQRDFTDDALADERLDAVVIGPGLGRSDQARELVARVLSHHRLKVVLDADALNLFEPAQLCRIGTTILTPHYGEYSQMKERFGLEKYPECDLLTQLASNNRAFGGGGCTSVLVFKGATTYVVGHSATRIAPQISSWLSTAGTGDVLAGVTGAMAAAYANVGGSMTEAAAAAVWIHAEAARRLGASFIADDLAAEISSVRANL